MAVINPFKALRYDEEKIGSLDEIISPPYDVVNDEDYKYYAEENQYNIINLELPKGENPYKNAKHLLKLWKEKGILKRDAENSLYIYEEEFKVGKEIKKIKGFICTVKLEDFSKGIILPHERTLSKAKEDRFKLMEATNCNISQIYSLYIDDENNTKLTIEKLSSKKSDIEAVDKDGIIHRLWIITDKDEIDKICKDFKSRKLYIADGHHRYETALRYHKTRCENGLSDESSPDSAIMMMLVDMDNSGLVVFPTHRMIKNIDNFNKKALIEECSKYFEIIEYNDLNEIGSTLKKYYDNDQKAFVLYTGDTSFTLMVLKDINDLEVLIPNGSEHIRTLDVTILHELILSNILKISTEDLAKQTKLSYTRDLKEAVEAVKSKEFQCSFILNPTRVVEIKNVAAANEKMPQKSTYFYPKLITGLVMNDLTTI